MTIAAKYSLDKAAQLLKRPNSDIVDAVPEVLNRKTAIMFTVEDVEKLGTYFREKDSARGGGQRKKLTVTGKFPPRKTGARSAVPIEYRKQRGKGRVRGAPKTPAEQVPAKVEVVEEVPEAIVPQPAPPINDKEAQQKRDEQNKLLDKVSSLNTAKVNSSGDADGQVAEAEVEEKEPSVAEAAPEQVPDDKPPAAEKTERTAASKKKVGHDRRTLTVEGASVAERNKKLRRRRAAKGAPSRQAFQLPEHVKAIKVEIHDKMSPRILATAMSLKIDAVMEKLAEIEEGVEETDVLEPDTAWLVVEEFGHHPVKAISVTDSEYIASIKDAVGKDVVTRHPVVTIMGHVDHGKTSLLDYMRKSKITEGESGGITQHIGAYQVDTPAGMITFIDTPGHEVFTEMRARGANATDIVVLVVAADDGVQPQTREAIDHAKAAGVPIVVALNKIDLVETKKDDVLQQLSAEGLQPEDWGGDILVVPVSAVTGEGIDKLQEAILLTAEMHGEHLKASLDVDAHGTVIEVKTVKGLGPVITGIVRQGVLRKSQFLLCDTAYGRIRTLQDENGKNVTKVGPSTPVQITGISEMPTVGCEFFVADSEAKAREHADERKHRLRQQELANQTAPVEADSFEEHLEMMQRDENRKILNLIIKADVAGTCEALENVLGNIGNADALVSVIHSGVGAVTDSDVTLAQASNATLIGFRVTANGKTHKMINERNVQTVFEDVFYEVSDRVKAMLEGMLVPVVEEHVRGRAKVKEVFSIHKVGRIAGCGVVEGTMDFKLPVRVVRDGAVVYKTKIHELRHHKDKVQSINSGSDCGIHLEKFSDYKPGDMIESLEEISTKPTL